MRSISSDDWWTINLFVVILDLFVVDLFQPHHNQPVDLFTVDRWIPSMSQAFLSILTMLRRVTKYINDLSMYYCVAFITTLSGGLSTFSNHQPLSGLSTSALCRSVDQTFLIHRPSSLLSTFVKFPCISFDVKWFVEIFLARSSISFDLDLVVFFDFPISLQIVLLLN